jgi:hypothetical protein
MRWVLVIGFSLFQLTCATYEAVYPVQTDGSQTLPQAGNYRRLAVWGTAPSVVGAATAWLQKRGGSGN